jgi:hypothetical protein
MTAEIRADSQIGTGRNGEVKMGIETGDAMYLVEGCLSPLRK